MAVLDCCYFKAHILTSRHPGSLRPWHADTPPWPWDRPLGDDPRGSRDEESIAYFPGRRPWLIALIKDSRRTQMAGRWSMTYFVCCQLPRLPRLSWVGVGVGWMEREGAISMSVHDCPGADDAPTLNSTQLADAQPSWSPGSCVLPRLSSRGGYRTVPLITV